MRRAPEFQSFLEEHGGVFRRRDAISLGVSPKRFEVGVRRGEWVRFRGAWILADSPRGRTAITWSVLLRFPSGARITGITCLAMHGFEPQRWELHISLPSELRATVDKGVVLRDRCRTQTAAMVRGMPSVSRSRAIADALRVVPLDAGRELLHEMLRRRWTSVRQLQWWSEQLRGHKGMSAFQAHLKYADSGTQAESEALLRRLFQTARLRGWLFNEPICDEHGQLLGVGDCVHARARIVIEVDGMAWHTTPDRFQRDRERQNSLVNDGWHVLRFTWTDLTRHPDRVLDEVTRALGTRGVGTGHPLEG